MYGVFVSQGGYSRFHVTGKIEWGQKSKPKKIPRGSNEPKKFPGPKINPPKNPMPNFQALKISSKDYPTSHERKISRIH